MPTDTPEKNKADSSSCCSKPVSEWLSCRQVLYMMVLLGFMFNYMLRVNLTIAIVAMVKSANSTLNATSSTNLTDNIFEEVGEEDSGLYDWDSYIQNMILGSFFFGYICTELPGGRLAEVVGARRVFGYSMLCASLVTLVTPLACNIHYIAVIVLRAILGFMLGATWPAIPPMIAKWVPPMERSKFMANMMASSLGAAITLPVCGFLIVTLGWESVFYITGAVGVLWSVAWFALISDSPAEHPRITDAERRFIEDAIGTTSSKGKDVFLGPLQSVVGCVLSSWIDKDMCLRPPDPYDKVKTLESSNSSWEGHKGVRTLRTGILTYSDAREVEAKLADGISTDSETEDNTRCTRRMWPPPKRSLLESDSNDESSQAAVMQMKSTDNRVVEHHAGEWFRQNMSRMKKAGLVVTSPQTPHLQLDTEAAFSPHGPGASDNDMGLHYLQL